MSHHFGLLLIRWPRKRKLTICPFTLLHRIASHLRDIIKNQWFAIPCGKQEQIDINYGANLTVYAMPFWTRTKEFKDALHTRSFDDDSLSPGPKVLDSILIVYFLPKAQTGKLLTSSRVFRWTSGATSSIWQSFLTGKLFLAYIYIYANWHAAAIPFLYPPCHTVGPFLPCLGNYVVSYQKGQVKDTCRILGFDHQKSWHILARLLLLCASEHSWGMHMFLYFLRSILWIWWHNWLDLKRRSENVYHNAGHQCVLYLQICN